MVATAPLLAQRQDLYAAMEQQMRDVMGSSDDETSGDRWAESDDSGSNSSSEPDDDVPDSAPPVVTSPVHIKTLEEDALIFNDLEMLLATDGAPTAAAAATTAAEESAAAVRVQHESDCAYACMRDSPS